MPLVLETLGHNKENDQTKADILIYGQTKAGKTRLCSTAPGPIYLLSPDPTGHKSFPFPVDGQVIHQIDHLRETIINFREGGHGYQTIVVDGLSWIADLWLKEMGHFYHTQHGAKDPDLMPISGRIKILNAYKNFLRALLDLTQVPNEKDRVHVICTTLEERVKEDEDIPLIIRPLFGTASMNNAFGAFFSTILYIAPLTAPVNTKSITTEKAGAGVKLNQTRAVLAASYGSVRAGDRLDIFPALAHSPPFKLTDYLKGGGASNARVNITKDKK